MKGYQLSSALERQKQELARIMQQNTDDALSLSSDRIRLQNSVITQLELSAVAPVFSCAADLILAYRL